MTREILSLAIIAWLSDGAPISAPETSLPPQQFQNHFQNLLDGDAVKFTRHDSGEATARGPDGWIGGAEDGDDGSAGRCGQVGDSGVIADVDARGSDPAGEVHQILETHGISELFRGSGAPGDRIGQAPREVAIGMDGPVFARASREGMNDSEI